MLSFIFNLLFFFVLKLTGFIAAICILMNLNNIVSFSQTSRQSGSVDPNYDYRLENPPDRVYADQEEDYYGKVAGVPDESTYALLGYVDGDALTRRSAHKQRRSRRLRELDTSDQSSFENARVISERAKLSGSGKTKRSKTGRAHRPDVSAHAPAHHDVTYENYDRDEYKRYAWSNQQLAHYDDVTSDQYTDTSSAGRTERSHKRRNHKTARNDTTEPLLTSSRRVRSSTTLNDVASVTSEPRRRRQLPLTRSLLQVNEADQRQEYSNVTHSSSPHCTARDLHRHEKFDPQLLTSHSQQSLGFDAASMRSEATYTECERDSGDGFERAYDSEREKQLKSQDDNNQHLATVDANDDAQQFTTRADLHYDMYGNPAHSQSDAHDKLAQGQTDVYGSPSLKQNDVYGDPALWQNDVYGDPTLEQNDVYGDPAHGQSNVYGNPAHSQIDVYENHSHTENDMYEHTPSNMYDSPIQTQVDAYYASEHARDESGAAQKRTMSDARQLGFQDSIEMLEMQRDFGIPIAQMQQSGLLPTRDVTLPSSRSNEKLSTDVAVTSAAATSSTQAPAISAKSTRTNVDATPARQARPGYKLMGYPPVEVKVSEPEACTVTGASSEQPKQSPSSSQAPCASDLLPATTSSPTTPAAELEHTETHPSHQHGEAASR